LKDPLDYTWGEEQSQYALMCAVEGDCIFRVVDKWSLVLGGRIEKIGMTVPKVLGSVTRGPWFGLAPPRVKASWLAALLVSEKNWPPELTRKERALLHLAVRCFDLTGKRPPASVEAPAGREESVRALRAFAAAVEKSIAIPIWRALDQTAKEAAREIAPLCESTLGEKCSLGEAAEIFEGDLERGLKVRSLEIPLIPSRILLAFLSWVKA
jgi:hypothetical protein